MLSTMVNNFMIRGAMYNLRKLFGKNITVYKRNTVTVDPEIGSCTPTYSTYNMVAVVLPEDSKREAQYDSTYLRSSRSFQYGAQYDTGTVEMIIDRRFLPVVLDQNDFIVSGGVRYDVVLCERTADERAFLVTTKQAAAVGVP